MASNSLSWQSLNMNVRKNRENIGIFLGFGAKALREEIWLKRPRNQCFLDFHVSLIHSLGIQKAQTRNFSNYLAVDTHFHEPAYNVMRKDGEALIASIKNKPNWPDMNCLIENAMYLVSIRSFHDTHFVQLVKQLFVGAVFPMYQPHLHQRKRHHLLYHYTCLVIHYVLARLLGQNQKDSFRFACHFARISALDAANELMIQSFLSLKEFRDYCDMNHLIFNVAANGLALRLYDRNKPISSFIVTQVHDCNKVEIISIYHDKRGDGVSDKLDPSKSEAEMELYNIVKQEFVRAVRNQGGLRKVIEKESVQYWPNGGPRNCSIRLISNSKGVVVFKCTIWYRPKARKYATN